LSVRYFNALVSFASAVVIVWGLSAPSAAAAAEWRILALGDSLTAGYGLAAEDGFARQLEAALDEAGVNARVVNGGVSGDTSAGGLARADWLLAEKPDLVIIELGANDALRGLEPADTRRNIDALVTKVKESGARVLLAGMMAPPNLGREYADAFNHVFPAVAKAHKVALYPFFLDGVAADPALNQADGIHPNAKGVSVIVERMLPALLKTLGETR
jgi:acyl-CoA thioesterase-1